MEFWHQRDVDLFVQCGVGLRWEEGCCSLVGWHERLTEKVSSCEAPEFNDDFIFCSFAAQEGLE